MYRLVLYSLSILLLVAELLSIFKILPYGYFPIPLSVLFLVVTGWLINLIFVKTFETQANVESVYISALIFALIIKPPVILSDYSFLFWATVLMVGGKFILAAYKKHLFNPVAISLVILSFSLNLSGRWWVGTASMLPFVLIAGFLIVRKIQRADLVFSFIFSALIVSVSLAVINGNNALYFIKQELIDSSLFFFAFIMLTEPLTTPPTKNLRIIYGTLIGIMFAPQVHIGSIYFTPELALVVGNIFSYLVSPKQKLMLVLKEKIKLSPDIYDFVFTVDGGLKKPFSFTPGQYLEWTLGHKNPDSRGNRRYFTIASSPTEKEIILGVRFINQYEKSDYGPSSFKQTLLSMNQGDKIMAGQLAGDFTLPKNKTQKLVLIAGGIGITPFRSMLKYLIDNNDKRPVSVIFVNRTAADIVYKNILDEAKEKLGINTIYSILKNDPHQKWDGHVGYIDGKMIKQELPNFSESMFYISGSKIMIDNFQVALNEIGVSKKNIKTDFFPGFA